MSECCTLLSASAEYFEERKILYCVTLVRHVKQSHSESLVVFSQ